MADPWTSYPGAVQPTDQPMASAAPTGQSGADWGQLRENIKVIKEKVVAENIWHGQLLWYIHLMLLQHPGTVSCTFNNVFLESFGFPIPDGVPAARIMARYPCIYRMTPPGPLDIWSSDWFLPGTTRLSSSLSVATSRDQFLSLIALADWMDPYCPGQIKDQWLLYQQSKHNAPSYRADPSFHGHAVAGGYHGTGGQAPQPCPAVTDPKILSPWLAAVIRPDYMRGWVSTPEAAGHYWGKLDCLKDEGRSRAEIDLATTARSAVGTVIQVVFEILRFFQGKMATELRFLSSMTPTIDLLREEIPSYFQRHSAASVMWHLCTAQGEGYTEDLDVGPSPVAKFSINHKGHVRTIIGQEMVDYVASQSKETLVENAWYSLLGHFQSLFLMQAHQPRNSAGKSLGTAQEKGYVLYARTDVIQDAVMVMATADRTLRCLGFTASLNN